MRDIIGHRDINKAKPGTIRGDFAQSNLFNVIHASDSKESSAREIKLYFKKNEIMNPEFYNKQNKFFPQ